MSTYSCICDCFEKLAAKNDSIPGDDQCQST